MKVAIHQPNFAPWLGFFHKLASVDTFVLFDDVMTPRGKSFVNRVKIKSQGKEAWLTIPVTGRGEQPLIRDLKTSGDNSWRRKILKTLEVSYRKAPHFEEVFSDVARLFGTDTTSICALNTAIICWAESKLKLNTKLIESSSMDLGDLNGEEKILAILEQLGAKEYLSGSGAGSRRYICEEDFARHGITLSWQAFEHPTYPQLGSDFLPNLSILDLMFCEGLSSTRKLLTSRLIS